jgi:hypothetical protein
MRGGVSLATAGTRPQLRSAVRAWWSWLNASTVRSSVAIGADGTLYPTEYDSSF